MQFKGGGSWFDSSVLGNPCSLKNIHSLFVKYLPIRLGIGLLMQDSSKERVPIKEAERDCPVQQLKTAIYPL